MTDTLSTTPAPEGSAAYRRDLVWSIAWALRNGPAKVVAADEQLDRISGALLQLVERSAWLGCYYREAAAEAEGKVERYRSTNGALMNDVDRQKNLAGVAAERAEKLEADLFDAAGRIGALSADLGVAVVRAEKAERELAEACAELATTNAELAEACSELAKS